MTRYLFWLFAITFFVAVLSISNCIYVSWLYDSIAQVAVKLPIVK
jgi:hypothetical protein